MTVTRESTRAPKATDYRCQISDAGGQCIKSAVLWIFSADSNAAEAERMSRKACTGHADHAFQIVGCAGGTCTPEFRVVPLGSLAERIRASVPVTAYMP